MRIVKWLLWLTVLIIVSGVFLAIYEPDNIISTPFRGMAIKTLEATSGMLGLLHDARTVAATEEFTVIRDALDSMMIVEQLQGYPRVTEPTDDMTMFPSAEHPLYPDYILRKTSQFSYTLTAQGELAINKEEASVDPELAGVLEKIHRLEKGESVSP